MSTFFLCCDVGGTNTSIGLMQKDEHAYVTLVNIQSYKSQEIADLTVTLHNTIALFKNKHSIKKIPPLCISAAGPTDGETCALSNLKNWIINRKEIEHSLHTPVFLINDFSAIAYSLMVLQTKQAVQISYSATQKTHSHASITDTTNTTKLVIGAGTGLGVAMLHIRNKQVSLIPTEGGWRHFSSSDPVTFLYYQYLSKNISIPCYWEEAISGKYGIPSICNFFANTQCSSTHELLPTPQEQKSLQQLITITDPKELAPTISINASREDSACKKIMDFWTILYAKFCSESATMCLPQGGLYIAGGIAAKNLSFFTSNNLFYTHFVQHNNQEIERLLKKIPMYVITDYYSSLYGDAYFLDTQL